MKTKRIMSTGLVGLLLAGGIVAGGALPASAHTPAASATCEALDINATYYETKPATDDTYEQQLVKDAVPYQPAVYGEPPLITPAVEYKAATYETEYEFRHKLLYWKTHWSTDSNWNAEENDHSLGWMATGVTRQGKLLTAEVPAQDAIYGPAPLISAEVPAQDAVYEQVLVQEGSPVDSEPNSVIATIDGVGVLNENFGSSFSDTIQFENKYIAHTWSVTITAWNDPDGSKGWTKTISGTTTPCDVPIVEANHNANGEATCGAWTINLYNQQGEYESTKTASFVVYIDGEFDNAYAVPGGEMQTISGTFEEDSGQHSVIVRTGAAQGDKFIFRLDEIKSDCVTPPVTEEPEEPTTPTTPVTPEKPAPAPVKAAVVAPITDALATTGGDPMGTFWGLTLAALLLASGAGATVLGIRRHQVKNQ